MGVSHSFNRSLRMFDSPLTKQYCASRGKRAFPALARAPARAQICWPFQRRSNGGLEWGLLGKAKGLGWRLI